MWSISGWTASRVRRRQNALMTFVTWSRSGAVTQKATQRRKRFVRVVTAMHLTEAAVAGGLSRKLLAIQKA
jgi:hypothetical protein